jgi:hypothetical protein
MDLAADPNGRQDNGSARANAKAAPTGMGYWRWLLFAAMARLERREESYLRIPSAKTTRHVVVVKIP